MCEIKTTTSSGDNLSCRAVICSVVSTNSSYLLAFLQRCEIYKLEVLDKKNFSVVQHYLFNVIYINIFKSFPSKARCAPCPNISIFLNVLSPAIALTTW